MGHSAKVKRTSNGDGFFLATMAAIVLLCLFTLIVLIGIF